MAFLQDLTVPAEWLSSIPGVTSLRRISSLVSGPWARAICTRICVPHSEATPLGECCVLLHVFILADSSVRQVFPPHYRQRELQLREVPGPARGPRSCMRRSSGPQTWVCLPPKPTVLQLLQPGVTGLPGQGVCSAQGRAAQATCGGGPPTCQAST